MYKLKGMQKKIVQGTTHGLVKGEKGVGKTTVATAKMIQLLEQSQAPVLMIGGTEETIVRGNTALQTIRENENMSLFTKESPAKQAHIYHIETFLNELAAYTFKDTYTCYNLVPELILQEAIAEIKPIYGSLKGFKTEIVLQEELNWIYRLGYTKKEEYLVANRTGCSMKWQKKGKAREAMWALKISVEKRMAKVSQKLFVQRDLEIFESLLQTQEVKRYTHLIVDDVHLLTPVQLRLLNEMRDQEGEVLFLAGQVNSDKGIRDGRVNGQSYKKLGYPMTGRVRTLKKITPKQKPAKKQAVGPTPLELFMTEKIPAKKPWYIASYAYTNKLTGVTTYFEQDTSAGESYIEAVKQEEMQTLPIYSDIAAGMPIEVVEESCLTFDIPGEIIGHKKQTYMLHVQGESMTGAGIEDGDYVVIQAGNVSNREIGAVYYNGAITLKRIVQEPNRVLLVSENPKYDPIVIEDGELRAMGRLIGVLKQL